jgi:hypothetical protein
VIWGHGQNRVNLWHSKLGDVMFVSDRRRVWKQDGGVINRVGISPAFCIARWLSPFFASRPPSVDNGSKSEVSWLWMFAFGLFCCAGFWSLDVV